jgi:hypothetical protein
VNWTREKPTKPGWYWVRCGNAVLPRIEEVAERWGKLYCQGFPAADYHQDWEFAGPIPEPGEVVTKPISSPPATCGECGIRGPACYPRVATDKACADARQEPSAAPGTTKEGEGGTNAG